MDVIVYSGNKSAIEKHKPKKSHANNLYIFMKKINTWGNNSKHCHLQVEEQYMSALSGDLKDEGKSKRVICKYMLLP